MVRVLYASIGKFNHARLCMYVCMYVCMNVCIYVYMDRVRYTSIGKFNHARLCMYVCTYIQMDRFASHRSQPPPTPGCASIHACMHEIMCVGANEYISTCILVCVHVYAYVSGTGPCARAHRRTHTQTTCTPRMHACPRTRTQTQTQTHKCVVVPWSSLKLQDSDGVTTHDERPNEPYTCFLYVLMCFFFFFASKAGHL
jgi:hypothetical protein